MNVASLKLSKELYELSNWRDTFSWWECSSIPNGDPHLRYLELERRYGLWSTQDVTELYPAYDLGYLSRKLPVMSLERVGDKWISISQLVGDRRVFSDPFTEPEDAMTNLAIELLKQGILKKQENN